MKGENYIVEVRKDEVILKGSMRLNGVEEYKKITDLLHQTANNNNGSLLINLSKLDLLNSSGITALCKYAINCRKDNRSLTVKWNESIVWQANLVTNLSRLLPTIKLTKDV